MLPLMSNVPAAYASGMLPGLPAVPQAGPSLPLENCGKMPAATQASTVGRNHGSAVADPPQELFTTCGRRSGSGFAPVRSVGARMNCPEDSSAACEQVRSSHPLAAIQVAPGATPIWLPLPSSPTMVPVTCVPWPLLSHGASEGSPHTRDGSHQL